MSLIGILSRFIIILYISVLKYYSLRLLQNCKNYRLKNRYCDDYLCILRYSPHKMKFNNLNPVIRAQNVVNLLSEGIFCYNI